MKRFLLNLCVVVAVMTCGSSLQAATVTAYYDFEGNFNDFPGAGLFADDLVNVTGGSLAADAASNSGGSALGSTMSYTFDNRQGNQTAQTDAYTTDLTSVDQYSIAFWYKGDNQAQDNNNTRLATVKNTAPNVAPAGDTGWQVEGFGQGSGDNMDLRIQNNPSPPNVGNFFSPDATGVLGGVNNDGNENNDEWHHVVFVVSNTGSDNNGFAYMETYVDGNSLGQSERGFATGTALLRNLDGELIIGGQAGNRGATGFLDDFALFDGVLTDDEIEGLAAGRLSPADFIPGANAVPEPTTAVLALLGAGAMFRRRQRFVA